MTQQDLKIMNVNDLKALVYDHLVLIENSQRAIQLITQEISIKKQSNNHSNNPQLVENNLENSNA